MRVCVCVCVKFSIYLNGRVFAMRHRKAQRSLRESVCLLLRHWYPLLALSVCAGFGVMAGTGTSQIVSLNFVKLQYYIYQILDNGLSI